MSKTETETVLGELVYFAHRLSLEFKELKIVPIGDVHFGNPLFSLKHLNRTRDLILSAPNIYTFLTGDLCETVVRDSLGDIYKQIETPQEQADWTIEYLTPIKDRILGMVSGNHERRIYNRVGFDISQYIAKALHVPYRDEGMLSRVTFGKIRAEGAKSEAGYTFYIYLTHGYGGARTDGAKAIKVQRTATYIDADVYIMSHDHTVNVAPDIYLTPARKTTVNNDGSRTGHILAKPKMLVKTNAYVKWGGYSEIGGYKPVNLVAPIITLVGARETTRNGQVLKEVKVEVSSG